MDSLTWVALGLVFFVIVLIVYCIVALHTLPGKIARKKNHPQVGAIEVCSLMGLIIFPFWMVAMVWANFRPPPMMMPGSKPEKDEPDGGAAPSRKQRDEEEETKVGKRDPKDSSGRPLSETDPR